MYFRKILSVMSVSCLLFLLACGPKPVAPKAELDTPEHHVTNGNKLLKAGEIDKAFKEFTRAKNCWLRSIHLPMSALALYAA